MQTFNQQLKIIVLVPQNIGPFGILEVGGNEGINISTIDLQKS